MSWLTIGEGENIASEVENVTFFSMAAGLEMTFLVHLQNICASLNVNCSLIVHVERLWAVTSHCYLWNAEEKFPLKETIKANLISESESALMAK